jgi:hypothetical protein
MIRTSRMSSYLLIMMVVVAAGGFLSTAKAQDPVNTDIYAPHGVMPNTDQLADSLDVINPASGQLNVTIPLGSLKGGPGGLGFDLKLLYDSNLYDFPNGFEGDWLKSAAGGWKYNIENYHLELDQLPDPADEPYPVSGSCGSWDSSGRANRFRLRIGLPDGSLHVLHLLQGPSNDDTFTSDFYTNTPAMKGFYAVDPSGIPYLQLDEYGTPLTYQCHSPRYDQLLTYYTTDGSHLKVEIPTSSTDHDWTNKEWRLYYPDGAIVVGMGDQVTEIHDSNGNTIVVDHIIDGNCSSYGYGTFTVFSYPGSSKRLIIQKHYAQVGTITRDRIIARGPNGDMAWYVDWDAVSTYPGFTFQAVKQIQLPLANEVAIGNTPPVYNSYVFGYYASDTTDGKQGFLHTIQTPSGSQYQYGYSFFLPYPFWKIAQKTISHDVSASLTWTFTYYGSGSCPSTPDLAGLCADVTNPDGGVSRHYYYDIAGGSFFNYQNASLPDSAAGLVFRVDGPSGSVHKRNWKQQSYSAQNVHLGQNLYLGSEAVTVGNAAGQPTKTAVTEFDYDASGNLTWKKEYDWVGFKWRVF